VSAETSAVASVGRDLSSGLGTAGHAAGIYPLGRLRLGGWKREAKAAVTAVSL